MNQSKTSAALALPANGRRWQVGAVVGDRQACQRAIGATFEIAPQRRLGLHAMLIDDLLPAGPVALVCQVLRVVGIDDVQRWSRPHAELTPGEQHRASLAAGLLGDGDPLVYSLHDELINDAEALVLVEAAARVVRKRVDLVGSRRLLLSLRDERHAVQVRPDWLGRLETGSLLWPQSWRGKRPRRRRVYELRVSRCEAGAWNSEPWIDADDLLPENARRYLGICRGQLLACVAAHWEPDRRGWLQLSHLNVRPSYRGVGIATQLLNRVAGEISREGVGVCIDTNHPLLSPWLEASPDWRIADRRGNGGRMAEWIGWREF